MDFSFTKQPPLWKGKHPGVGLRDPEILSSWSWRLDKPIGQMGKTERQPSARSHQVVKPGLKGSSIPKMRKIRIHAMIWTDRQVDRGPERGRNLPGSCRQLAAGPQCHVRSLTPRPCSSYPALSTIPGAYKGGSRHSGAFPGMLLADLGLVSPVFFPSEQAVSFFFFFFFSFEGHIHGIWKFPG